MKTTTFRLKSFHLDSTRVNLITSYKIDKPSCSNNFAYNSSFTCIFILCILKMEDSSEEGRDLFEQMDVKQESDEEPFSEQERSPKRLKKHKKEKKQKKKKRHIEYQEEDFDDQEEEDEYEDRAGVRGILEEEAEEDSDQESQLMSSAEFDGEERKRYEELYKVKDIKATQRFLDRYEGKNEAEINRIYQQKVMKRRANQTLVHSYLDHQMFIVSCKVGKEEDMALSILNKSAYYQRTQKQSFKIQITSALALKKKYPGKIFVEGPSEKAIQDGLQGFIDVNAKKIIPMDNDFYSSLFEAKETKDVSFKEQQFVRIKKGVYEGDLGKVYKTRKNNADVMLVPRINIQDILIKMREEGAKSIDEKLILANKDEILKRYINPRMHYPAHLRPPRKLLPIDVFRDFADLPYNRRINITSQGLIVLSFRYDEMAKPEGTMLPIEMQPFAKGGNLIEQFQEEQERKNFVTTIRLKKGEEAEINVGQLAGVFGTVLEIKENSVSMKVKNKEMQGRVVEEHIDHVSKRFKKGQRVRVVSGSEQGKTGTIIRLEGPYVEIWTDNQNSITINKNNLQVFQGEALNNENLLGIKKDDLIKTTKGQLGIVLSTNKDNIKILNTSNIIQIVGNLDYDTKINTRNLSARTKNGDQIKAQTIVRVRSGRNQGRNGQVRHVYRDYVFIFNKQLDRTSGLAVQKADNCVVVAKNLENQSRRFPNKFPQKPQPQTMGTSEEDEDIKVGRSITIRSGPLKGYRGTIKSVNKDRIEVRVPQKNCTEWISRDTVGRNQGGMDHGKTPRRGVSMTAMYAQSPMNF